MFLLMLTLIGGCVNNQSTRLPHGSWESYNRLTFALGETGAKTVFLDKEAQSKALDGQPTAPPAVKAPDSILKSDTNINIQNTPTSNTVPNPACDY